MSNSRRIVILIFLVGITICKSDQDVTKVKFADGNEMPAIGFGTWQPEWQPKGDQLVQAIKEAFRVGYRHIDTAWFLHNERDIGRALRKAIGDGVVKREDIFITYKVWPKNSNYKRTLSAVRSALAGIGTEYLDLVTIQWPLHNNSEVYRALEKAREDNLTHSIGVSNFKPHEIDALMKTARVKPAINHIRIHPGFNQDLTVDYCHQNGIAVVGWSPFGSGSLLKDPIIVGIGNKHNKTAAQVLIRWQLQRGLAVIPKSQTKKTISEYFNVIDFTLDSNDMNAIHSMPQINIVDFWG